MLLASLDAGARAPVLYSTGAYQSPVRADPDDLLLIPGYGFSPGDAVVYQALADTTAHFQHPASVPTTSSSTLGIADIASTVDAPYSLTIHLPASMQVGQSYAFWVVTPQGDWSNGIRINDARPLWISPNELFSRAPLGSLPRVLKVVGRNLEPAPQRTARVRLIGTGKTYDLEAASFGASGELQRYVLTVALPAMMVPGRYRVLVSRDGVSWVALSHDTEDVEQSLQVLKDPPRPRSFRVGEYRFGACDPSTGDCATEHAACPAGATEGQDATACVAAAIAAAGASGGGVVEFGSRTWRLDDPGEFPSGRVYSRNGVSRDGILVPAGVSLLGEGWRRTRVVRGAHWEPALPSFALLGHNQVTGFTFAESHRFVRGETGASFLALGPRWDRLHAYRANVSSEVSHVVISDNEFDKPFVAIANNGLAIDHLVVTHNLFGAYQTAIELEANLNTPYHFRDSIVAHNQFFPGSALDIAAGQGAIATGLSGGLRTDFSDNEADGTSTRYLYDAQHDARGWRAGFFWTMNDNVEFALVSENKATCTGDKDGDGEAIAYDNNHNRPGFADLAVPVMAAVSPDDRSSTLTVRGALIESQYVYGHMVDVGAVEKFYLGDWVQVVQGPGMGQARKVVAITTGRDGTGPTVTFRVVPRFDVLPDAGSLVTDGRLFWQTYTLANHIDHRAPLCLKSNRTRHGGGLIVLYASTVDSVVEGNEQFDTSGIEASHIFKMKDPAAGVFAPEAFVQSFNEIRGNLIDGAYDDADISSLAKYGIFVAYGATPHTPSPPVLSYGLSISHNRIRAAGASKGAIALNHGWYTGPASHAWPGETPWKLASSTLIFKNTLADIGQPGPKRVAIGLDADSRSSPIEWRSVLYGNSCQGDALPVDGLVDNATQTVRYCPSMPRASCECGGIATELTVSCGAPSASGVSVGRYAVTCLVTNRGAATASHVTLSIESSSTARVVSLAGPGASCDTADSNVNLCHLERLEPGESSPMEVSAEVAEGADADVIVAVTQAETASSAGNNVTRVLLQSVSTK